MLEIKNKVGEMIIGFLGPVAPFRGGIAQFLHNMADYCVKDNKVIVFSFIKQYPKLIFPGKSQTEELNHDFKYPVYRTLIPYNPLTWKKTADQIIDNNIEHLIIKFWIPFFSPAYTFIINYLKKRSNIKIHILCHNLDFHEKWFFAEKLTQRMLKNSDSIIVLSDTVYKSAQKFNPKKVLKLFHPLYEVETTNLKKSESCNHLKIKNTNTLLFFGYIKDYKGLDVFLKSIPYISKDFPDLQYVIAGEVYGDDKKYKSIIDSYYNQYNIEFHNKFIKTDDIKHYFSSCDAVVIPYKSATQSGIIQLANSYKKPVIASDIEGLKEMVIEDKTGFLFESENVLSLAKTIIRFFNNYKLLDFSENITINNQNYSWQLFTKKILDYLSE